ncbi:MAG: type IX secretion system membrane protein PorP/SprF, partial [Muribaculaceae bacterium]|nr:type IX secretion system membrane protein PorP/SprF [Muribaculaceae bacterium]
FGIGHRLADAGVATLAAELKNFYIGYSFDYATSALHSASSGSHELFVGYSLKLDLGEKNKNRHKSVRIL